MYTSVKTYEISIGRRKMRMLKMVVKGGFKLVLFHGVEYVGWPSILEYMEEFLTFTIGSEGTAPEHFHANSKHIMSSVQITFLLSPNSVIDSLTCT